MQRAFDLIKQRLEKERHPEICGGWETLRIDRAIEIVNEVAEECGDGWIPVSSGKLPEGGAAVIVSYKDRFLPQADGTCDGWYDEPNRMWHLEDYECSDNAEVTAWREKLEPYKAESETNADYIRAMSDEELAEFLVDVETHGYHDQSISGTLEMIDWLKSERKE